MPDFWMQVGMHSVVPETRQLDRVFLLSSCVLNQMLTSQTHYTLHRILLMRLSGYYHPNIASIQLSLLWKFIHNSPVPTNGSKFGLNTVTAAFSKQYTFHLHLRTLSVFCLASNLIVPDGPAGTAWEFDKIKFCVCLYPPISFLLFLPLVFRMGKMPVASFCCLQLLYTIFATI